MIDDASEDNWWMYGNGVNSAAVAATAIAVAATQKTIARALALRDSEGRGI
jgi:hypothetical protein